jgi:hypothetical protein
MARYRNVLRRVKVKTGKRFRHAGTRLAALGPASLNASRLLLRDKRARRCGGGVRPSILSTAQTKLLSSDENGMRVRVELPALRFVPQTGGGRAWTKLALPNTDAPSAPGSPGIPIVSSTFGVPDGAALTVTPDSASSYTVQGVDIFPAQPDTVDDVPPPDFTAPPFATAPFTIDKSAYKRRGLVPSKPAAGQILGTARDIVIGSLQVPAAQYDAARRKLKVLNSVVVEVKFVGGSHTFNSELGSTWEHAQRTFASTLLNADLIRAEFIKPFPRCGEEMLVITNPATRPAADQFANARSAAGLRVAVVETGSGAGQIGVTPGQIQAYIRSRLTSTGCIHPSYVTILGDDDLVPTFAADAGIPSDLDYSMRDDADELPDLAVGRIIGNDQAAVAAGVTKIVTYETTPPTGPMLTRASIAAEFQDDNVDGREDRTFIQFAETVRNGLVNRGVAVDRIYDESGFPATPLKFNDGTDLPAELKKPTFAWDGNTADITTAWNEGRFLMIHRDHGWSDGWGTPRFETTDVNALSNGSLLPVLMSINCSSAAYDYDETSFVGEALVKPNGGAVGAFGDTRDSPSWHNTQIALGFVDALLPTVLAGEGPALKQRTGFALIHGKLRLAGLAPPSGPGILVGDTGTRNELYLWHYFGDPSMQMWGGGGGPPIVINPALIDAVYQAQYTGPPRPDPPPYQVDVTLPAQFAGQTISLLRNGQVIGKAIAQAGTATIYAAFGDGAVKPGDLQVAMEADGAAPVSAPVEGVPKASPKLSQNCPSQVSTSDPDPPFTVSGKLQPGFQGATIRLVYTRPDSTTFTRTTTTDASGNWSHTIDPEVESSSSNRFGNWMVQSYFDGDSANNPAQTGACTVDVND